MLAMDAWMGSKCMLLWLMWCRIGNGFWFTLSVNIIIDWKLQWCFETRWPNGPLWLDTMSCWTSNISHIPHTCIASFYPRSLARSAALTLSHSGLLAGSFVHSFARPNHVCSHTVRTYERRIHMWCAHSSIQLSSLPPRFLCPTHIHPYMYSVQCTHSVCEYAKESVLLLYVAIYFSGFIVRISEAKRSDAHNVRVYGWLYVNACMYVRCV